jgi:hypothetical protein
MKTILVSFIAFLSFVSCSEKEIRLIVHAGNYNRSDCVVSADVSLSKPHKSTHIELYEQTENGEQAVASQLVSEKGEPPTLFWILSGETPAGFTRTYIVKKTKRETIAHPAMDVEDTQKTLILKKDGKPVLQYNYAHVNPPEGVDPVFGRSGFIHPAYSPAGNILTNIQPADHRHHYGIWNPWTHIVYDGKLYDLWNLNEKQGTVRAGEIEYIYKGDVFSGYTAILNHNIFTSEEEKTILNEYWKVKTWNTSEGFLWDFVSDLMPSTDLPVLIQEYRYAGFGYRATAEWTKENCEMHTSEGKTRQEIDGTCARWIYITGATSTGRSGLLFLSHPENYNAPEPLRIWDENANGGRGDAFINFAPTKNKDWELQPGKNYKLKYKVLAYEGEMTSERANRLWNDFAYPPQVKFNH